MLKLMLGAVVAGCLIALSAAPAMADEEAQETQIGHIRGPFPSSFVDAIGIARDAVCQDVYRMQLADGSFHEIGYCRFLPGASLPDGAPVTHDNSNSRYPFWSDYIFETTGEFELGDKWSVKVTRTGSIVAESFYPAYDPNVKRDERGSVIPNPAGGTITLSKQGLTDQLLYDVWEARVVSTYNNGETFEYVDKGNEEVTGIWDGNTGLLLTQAANGWIVGIYPADQRYVDGLEKP